MAISASEFETLGTLFWHARWRAIIRFSADGEFLEAIPLAHDMNADGTVTISDVWLWLEWGFWLIGDYVVIGMWREVPDLSVFWELSPAYLGGWFSGALSVVGIALLAYFALYLIVSVHEFIDDIRRNGL